MINKYLIVGLLCIAFILGVVHGFYVHESLNKAEINIAANKKIMDNYNISLDKNNINVSTLKILCEDS